MFAMQSSLAPQGVRPAAASGARPAPVVARRPSGVAGVPQGPPMMLAEVLCRQVRACRIPFGTAQRGAGPLAAVASPERVAQQPASTSTSRPLKVLIAGAGIGGLVLAVALLKKGIDVQIFERDMTAIRGEGKYRGPIQIQSNALAALEAIDEEVAEEVMASGCITGDRVNGLCDGVTGAWYVKFDTFHHAVDNGLPVTRVISRVTLQQILARAVERYAGPEAIQGNSHVMQYNESVSPETGLPVVSVTLEDGRVFSGDMLVGTDGIWSKTRKQMLGESAPNYSQYTCYTGISDFTPADIDVVGYRVFLGNRMYFVSSDVGGGKVQWYAFHKEPAGGTDPEGQRKRRLLELFGHWNDNVVDLIKATPEEDVLRRDIYDRPPIFKWSEGRVALLGDSAHAMQPNLGQGGCMAIEDAYRLADLLAGSSAQAAGDLKKIPVERLLKQYQNDRIMRVATIHGMAGMAAFMASTYKAYFGEGFSQWLVNTFHILHPGRVAGQLVMNLTMPAVLGWVLGGNVGTIAGSRKSTCRLEDHPKAFPERMFSTLMKDDEAIIRNCHADWLLAAERVTCYDTATTSSLLKGIYIDETPAVLGSTQASCSLLVEGPGVAERHAKVWKQRDGHHFLQDLKSGKGTWVNGVQLAPGATVELKFQDVVELGQHPAPEPFRVKMQHVSLRTDELNGHRYSTLMVGRKQEAVNAQAAAEAEAAAAVAADAAKLAVA